MGRKHKKARKAQAVTKEVKAGKIAQFKEEFVKGFWTHSINRLLFKFILLMGLFYALWVSPFFQTHVVQNMAQLYAQIGGSLLNLMGYSVTVLKDVVGNEEFSIGIKNGCDGIEGMAIFICAVLVYPIGFKQKLFGILPGMFFLFVLNLFRILSLYLIGLYIPSIFDLMHESIWQVLFIILTLVALFIWVNWVNQRKSN